MQGVCRACTRARMKSGLDQSGGVGGEVLDNSSDEKEEDQEDVEIVVSCTH